MGRLSQALVISWKSRDPPQRRSGEEAGAAGGERNGNGSLKSCVFHFLEIYGFPQNDKLEFRHAFRVQEKAGAASGECNELLKSCMFHYLEIQRFPYKEKLSTAVLFEPRKKRGRLAASAVGRLSQAFFIFWKSRDFPQIRIDAPPYFSNPRGSGGGECNGSLKSCVFHFLEI